MTTMDFLVYFIYSVAVFATFKLLMMFVNGGIHKRNALEWFLRGYFFSIGVACCFFTIIFVVRINMAYSK